MTSHEKPAGELSQSDFRRHRVWAFATDREGELPDETWMRPVRRLPVRSLSGRLVGAELVLANDQSVWGALGNVCLADPVSTEHFLSVVVFHPSAGRFELARYHEADYSRRGPAALSACLGLPVDSVFPISYDISDVAVGHPDCVRRSIPAVPTSRLSPDALIALALK
jgi:hypothetical protein